jgi:hypothetical protein
MEFYFKTVHCFETCTMYVRDCTCFEFSEFCTMTNDIPPDQPVWIEKDNIPGPTDGDTIIYPGDPVDPDEKVQLGYCKEWYCHTP